jgi:hypothetical protein
MSEKHQEKKERQLVHGTGTPAEEEEEERAEDDSKA